MSSQAQSEDDQDGSRSQENTGDFAHVADGKVLRPRGGSAQGCGEDADRRSPHDHSLDPILQLVRAAAGDSMAGEPAEGDASESESDAGGIAGTDDETDLAALTDCSIDDVLTEFNLLDRGMDIYDLVAKESIGSIKIIPGNRLVLKAVCGCAEHHAIVARERAVGRQRKVKLGAEYKCEVLVDATRNFWAIYRALIRWLLQRQFVDGSEHIASWQTVPQTVAPGASSASGA